MQAKGFFRKEVGTVLKGNGEKRVRLQLGKINLQKKFKNSIKLNRDLSDLGGFMSTQQQDTQAKAEQYTSHNVMLENGTCKAKASFLVSSVQPAAHAAARINTILGCSIRLLRHTELPRTLQGAIRTMPSAECPGCGLLLPLQQPGQDCTGVCLQKPGCPSPSEPRAPPATLSCYQEPRPGFDCPSIMEICFPCPCARLHLRGQSVTLLPPYSRERMRTVQRGRCWRSGCHPVLGQKPPASVQECTPQKNNEGLWSFSVSPPKPPITPFFPQQTPRWAFLEN